MRLPEAAALLESVRENADASSAVKAHAALRLAELSARSGDWNTALSLAEQLQTLAPFDLGQRGAGVALLPPDSQAAALSEDLRTRIEGLRVKLNADRQAVCQRFFAQAVLSSAAAHCPVQPGKER